MTTIILTGLWGSGKTMAARIIHEQGVRMDLALGGIAEDFEDEQMHYHLTFHPHTLPIGLIRARDEAHPAWGFKHAAAWDNLHPQSVHNIFRSPRVVMLHRDPANLAAHTQMRRRDVLAAMARAEEWAARLECPVLHLSSETLFRAPQSAAETLRGFLGVKVKEVA